MILAMYPPRVKSFQGERGYIYLGLAVRCDFPSFSYTLSTFFTVF